MKKVTSMGLFFLFFFNLSANEVIIPHLTAENTAWGSFIQADNLDATSQTFTLTLFRDGEQVFTQEYTIAGLERQIINLSEIAPNGVCGKIEYQSANLLFRLSYESFNGGGLAEFALDGDTSKELSFLFSDFSTSIEWKGIAIANLSDQEVNGTLYALGTTAVLDQTNITVPAKTRIRGVHSSYFPDLTFQEVKRFVLVAEEPLSGISISGDFPSGKLLFTKALGIQDFTAPPPSYLGTWTGAWQSTEDTAKTGNSVLKVLTQDGDDFTGTLDIYNTDCGDVLDLVVAGTVVDNVFDFEIAFTCIAFPVTIHFFEGVLGNDTITGKYEQTLSGDFHDRGTFSLTRESNE